MRHTRILTPLISAIFVMCSFAALASVSELNPSYQSESYSSAFDPGTNEICASCEMEVDVVVGCAGCGGIVDSYGAGTSDTRTPIPLTATLGSPAFRLEDPGLRNQ